MPVKQCTILNTASLSEVVDLEGFALARITMPAAWTAAVLTFKVGASGSVEGDYYKDDGTEISLTVAASRVYRMPPLDWDGVRYIQLRSGTGAAAVAQGGDRLIKLDLVRRD